MSTKKLSPILEKKHGPVTFALFLRAARESLELSQTEMAQKLGMTKGTLCDLEKGRQLVSVSLAKKIANKAKLSVALAIKACIQDQLNKANVHLTFKLVA